MAGRRVTRGQVLRALLGIVVVGLAFGYVLPWFASYAEVSATLRALDPPWWTTALLLVVGAVNLIAAAGLQRAALPGLGWTDAVLVDWVTTTVTNILPGGSAVAMGLTWSMYRRVGLAGSAIARALVVSGVWDQAVKLSAPLLAVVWLSTVRPVSTGLVRAAIVGAVLFAVVVAAAVLLLAGPGAIAGVGRLADRLPWPAAGSEGWSRRLQRLRDDTILLVRHRWAELTVWSVGGHLNLFVLLLVCVRIAGVGSGDLPTAAVFTALAFGRLVTAIPVTPGGVGVFEVGLTAALTAIGSAEEASVVAAVLVFRLASFALPVLLGVAVWPLWSVRERSLDERDPVEPAFD